MASGLDHHLNSMVRLADGLVGFLSARDVRFLALVGALLPPELGEVLEIGSFRGKSTVILAKSIARAGGTGMSAVDPHDLPHYADAGEDIAALFAQTLKDHGVRDMVEHHAMRSGDLAKAWERPLRLLWIDGDHSAEGARGDVLGFQDHVQPGGIVAQSACGADSGLWYGRRSSVHGDGDAGGRAPERSHQASG